MLKSGFSLSKPNGFLSPMIWRNLIVGEGKYGSCREVRWSIYSVLLHVSEARKVEAPLLVLLIQPDRR